MSIKIGIITASSNVFPRMGKDLITGIRSALKKEGFPKPEIFVEDTGVGGNEKLLAEKAQKILLQHDPQLVIAFGEREAYAVLEKIFIANEVPVIFTNIGGNVPFDLKGSEYSFLNSFDIWLSSRFFGNWAVENGSQKFSLASSFYDSGYEIVSSFLKGIENAGGGVDNWFIPQQVPGPEGFAAYHEQIKNKQIDSVFAVFSREETIEFLKGFSQEGIGTSTQLLAAGTMLIPHFLNGNEELPEGIIHCMSWAPSLPGEANQVFQEAIKENTGKSATIFHLLGWEAGLILAEAIRITGSEDPFPEAIAQALPKIKIEGPRGPLEFKTRKNQTRSNHFLFKSKINNGKWEHDYVSQLDIPEKLEEQLIEEEKIKSEIPNSGWNNPYFCV